MALENCQRIIFDRVIFDEDEPFNMCVELPLHGKPDPVTDVADSSVMWLANAHLARHRGLTASRKCVADFPRVRVPAADLRTPVMDMHVEALVDALILFVWRLDADLMSSEEVRDHAWFAEAKELLELLLHRAYFLATETLTKETHNVLEYVDADLLEDVDLPEGGDSDDEMPDVRTGTAPAAGSTCCELTPGRPR